MQQGIDKNINLEFILFQIFNKIQTTYDEVLGWRFLNKAVYNT